MSAAPGRPQGSHGEDRKQGDYDAFAAQCNGKGTPIDVFYPGLGVRPDEARVICKECPVQMACLQYALKYNETYGIWGGFTSTERRVIKRQQKVFADRAAARQ